LIIPDMYCMLESSSSIFNHHSRATIIIRFSGHAPYHTTPFCFQIPIAGVYVLTMDLTKESALDYDVLLVCEVFY
jgi:hypothetical protein